MHARSPALSLLIAAAALAAPIAAVAGAGHAAGHGPAPVHGHADAKTHAHAAANAHGHGTAFGAPGAPADVERTIEVVMTDNDFDREAIRVRPGETVRFVVRNEGRIVHEFNLGTPEMHRAHEHQMMEMLRDGRMSMTEGMIADDGHRHANSLLLSPGESGALIWTFAQTANLEFACNVPGHYQAGMHGAIRF